MKHVHIMCIASDHIYTEVIDAMTSYFIRRGYRVTQQYPFKIEPNKELFSHDINIVIKAQRFFNPKQLPKSSLKILFQSEQFEKLRQFESMPHFESWDLILDVFQDNVLRIAKVAIPTVRFFPIGYDKAYDANPYKTFLHDERCNLDCYFFGARTNHRVHLWNKYVLAVVANARLANQDIGPVKYSNIIHSKINIFMSAWEPYFVPTMHIMQILANRKFLIVVSETPQDYYPYKNNKHFMVIKPSELKDVIKTGLKSPLLREIFVEQKMWPDLINNHRFEDYFQEALKGFIE